MRRRLLLVVSGVNAALQLLFARAEMFGWGYRFVAGVAPKWVDHRGWNELDEVTGGKIDWAEDLADNMGAYNLVLALGLPWCAPGAGVP
jgi:hypothetical protein